MNAVGTASMNAGAAAKLTWYIKDIQFKFSPRLIGQKSFKPFELFVLRAEAEIAASITSKYRAKPTAAPR